MEEVAWVKMYIHHDTHENNRDQAKDGVDASYRIDF